MTSPTLETVLALPVAEKLARLARMSADQALGIELLIDSCIKENWAEQFHAGPRGGLKLKGGLE